MDIARRLKPSHLSLILKIAETRQLQLAAQAVGMSQPAASRVLAEIEGAVGGPLFTRHPKGMEVTQAGAVVVRHARVILSEMRSLRDELHYLSSGELGQVRVGSVTGPAVGCLMPAVQAVQRDSPDLLVNVEIAPSSALLRGLEEGAYDFILGRIPPGYDARAFHVHPARTEVVKLMVHATHPLAGARGVRLRDLGGYPWVMQAIGSPIRQAVDEAHHRAGVPTPPRVLNSSSLLVALAQLARTRAIAPQSDEVRELLVQPEMGARLVALDLAEDIIVPPYFLMRPRKGEPSRAVDRLLAQVLVRL